MILEHLDLLRNQLNSLILLQRYALHKKLHLVESKLTLKKFFMKKTDYACLKNYSIKTLLACEIGSMPYYLFKNGQLRKAKKSELKNVLRKIVPICLPIKSSQLKHDCSSHSSFHGKCKKSSK